jgi:hypothetical protein
MLGTDNNLRDNLFVLVGKERLSSILLPLSIALPPVLQSHDPKRDGPRHLVPVHFMHLEGDCWWNGLDVRISQQRSGLFHDALEEFFVKELPVWWLRRGLRWERLCRCWQDLCREGY